MALLDLPQEISAEIFSFLSYSICFELRPYLVCKSFCEGFRNNYLFYSYLKTIPHTFYGGTPYDDKIDYKKKCGKEFKRLSSYHWKEKYVTKRTNFRSDHSSSNITPCEIETSGIFFSKKAFGYISKGLNCFEVWKTKPKDPLDNRDAKEILHDINKHGYKFFDWIDTNNRIASIRFVKSKGGGRKKQKTDVTFHFFRLRHYLTVKHEDLFYHEWECEYGGPDPTKRKDYNHRIEEIDVKDWKVKDVNEWFERIGLNVKRVFDFVKEKKGINGKKLLELDNDNDEVLQQQQQQQLECCPVDRFNFFNELAMLKTTRVYVNGMNVIFRKLLKLKNMRRMYCRHPPFTKYMRWLCDVEFLKLKFLDAYGPIPSKFLGGGDINFHNSFAMRHPADEKVEVFVVLLDYDHRFDEVFNFITPFQKWFTVKQNDMKKGPEIKINEENKQQKHAKIRLRCGLAIGNVMLTWERCGLVSIKLMEKVRRKGDRYWRMPEISLEAGIFPYLLSFDLPDKFKWSYPLVLAKVCRMWNLEYSHCEEQPDCSRKTAKAKERNEWGFVEEILESLELKNELDEFMKGSTALAFLQKSFSSNGFAHLTFQSPRSELFKVPHTFVSHIEFDTLIQKERACLLKLEMEKGEEEENKDWRLLRAYDRVFWYLHLKYPKCEEFFSLTICEDGPFGRPVTTYKCPFEYPFISKRGWEVYRNIEK